MSFNVVVFRNKTKRVNNIHLSVHPFYQPFVYSMYFRGDYKEHIPYNNGGIALCWRPLADKLWDNIPGLNVLFFLNGEIILQHSGVFPDNEIIEAAREIILPYLEEQLKLNNLYP